MRLRTPAIAAAAALAALSLACALVQPATSTSAGYIARVTNATNTAATASTFTCAQAATQDSALVAYPMREASGSTTAADISGNNRTGAYQSTMTTNTAASRSCPRDPAGAYVLAGNTGLSNTCLISPSMTSTTAFSIEVWFKTASTTSTGLLVGFGSSNSSVTASVLFFNRILYLSTTGTLNFGVSSNTVIVGPSTYRDMNWHHALVTVTSTTSTLYVDGVSVASGTSGAAAVAPTSGYWRFGFDAMTTWPNTNLNMAFPGSMRYGSIYGTALSATAVANHYRAATPHP